MDDAIDHLARALDHVDDGEQDLAIGFTELFDDGGRLLAGCTTNLQLRLGLRRFIGRHVIATVMGRHYIDQQSLSRQTLGCNPGVVEDQETAVIHRLKGFSPLPMGDTFVGLSPHDLAAAGQRWRRWRARNGDCR
jgi:hypothetical protein